MANSNGKSIPVVVVIYAVGDSLGVVLATRGVVVVVTDTVTADVVDEDFGIEVVLMVVKACTVLVGSVVVVAYRVVDASVVVDVVTSDVILAAVSDIKVDVEV